MISYPIKHRQVVTCSCLHLTHCPLAPQLGLPNYFTQQFHTSMPFNLLSALGKVFAVRRIRPSKSPPITTPPSINITCPPQEPGFTSSARIPNTDPSNNDSRSDQMREYGILALTMTAPIAGSIPVVGSPLKSVVDALLEILKAADVSLQCVPAGPWLTRRTTYIAS